MPTTNLLQERINNLECERYIYVTKSGYVCLFQRMSHNRLWYVTVDGQIVNYGTYRHDLQEWLDEAISDESLKLLGNEK